MLKLSVFIFSFPNVLTSARTMNKTATITQTIIQSSSQPQMVNSLLIRAEVDLFSKSTDGIPEYKRYVPKYNQPVFAPEEIAGLPPTLAEIHGTAEFSLDGTYDQHIGVNIDSSILPDGVDLSHKVMQSEIEAAEAAAAAKLSSVSMGQGGVGGTFLTDIDVEATVGTLMVKPTKAETEPEQRPISPSPEDSEQSINYALRHLPPKIESETPLLPNNTSLQVVQNHSSKVMQEIDSREGCPWLPHEKKIWNMYFNHPSSQLIIRDAVWFVICDVFEDRKWAKKSKADEEAEMDGTYSHTVATRRQLDLARERVALSAREKMTAKTRSSHLPLTLAFTTAIPHNKLEGPESPKSGESSSVQNALSNSRPHTKWGASSLTQIKNKVKSRLAAHFVSLFMEVRTADKDWFFKFYHMGLAQTIFYALDQAFPASSDLIRHPFLKLKLQQLCSDWILGHVRAGDMSKVHSWLPVEKEQHTEGALVRLASPVAAVPNHLKQLKRAIEDAEKREGIWRDPDREAQGKTNKNKKGGGLLGSPGASSLRSKIIRQKQEVRTVRIDSGSVSDNSTSLPKPMDTQAQNQTGSLRSNAGSPMHGAAGAEGSGTGDEHDERGGSRAQNRNSSAGSSLAATVGVTLPVLAQATTAPTQGVFYTRTRETEYVNAQAKLTRRQLERRHAQTAVRREYSEKGGLERKLIRPRHKIYHSELIQHYLTEQNFNSPGVHSVTLPITQPGPELSASSLLLAAHKKVNLANKVEYQELYCEKPTAGGRGRKKTHIPGKIQQQIQEDKEEEKQALDQYKASCKKIVEDKAIALRNPAAFAKQLVVELENKKIESLKEPSKSLSLRRMGHFRTVRDEQLTGSVIAR